MSKLVIVTEELLKVGQYYHDLRDPLGVAHPEQMFLVIGESTREEWVNCLVSFGQDRSWADLLSYFGSPYFYEIETD